MSDDFSEPRLRRSAVLFGDGRGGFPRRRTFRVPIARYDYVGVANPALGDFNRDGRLDLAVTESGNNGSPGVWVLLGDGKGGFSARRKYQTTAGAGQAAVADFNLDHNPDLAVAAALDPISAPYAPAEVRVLLGDGRGDFPVARSYFAGDESFALAAGDLNGDRNPDLAVVNGSAYGEIRGTDVRLLFGDGSGGFSLAKVYRAGRPPGGVVLADFNRDGKLDLGVTNDVFAERRTASANVWLLVGDGGGDFRSARRLTTGRQPCCAERSIAAADLNRDGRPDLIVTNGSEKGISVFLSSISSQHAAPTR
jgi:hypothetical protein